MSLRPDGTYRCDSCGGDLGNGGAHVATKVYGRDPADPFMLRQLDLCIEPREDADFGCTGLVLTPEALPNYYETRNA